jgi:hypothetical protein
MRRSRRATSFENTIERSRRCEAEAVQPGGRSDRRSSAPLAIMPSAEPPSAMACGEQSRTDAPEYTRPTGFKLA